MFSLWMKLVLLVMRSVVIDCFFCCWVIVLKMIGCILRFRFVSILLVMSIFGFSMNECVIVICWCMLVLSLYGNFDVVLSGRCSLFSRVVMWIERVFVLIWCLWMRIGFVIILFMVSCGGRLVLVFCGMKLVWYVRIWCLWFGCCILMLYICVWLLMIFIDGFVDFVNVVMRVDFLDLVGLVM